MKKCFRSAKWIYALCLSKKSKILSLAYLKADDSTLFLNRDIHMYDKCMTKQNENRVAGIYNAVSVRSEADSNRCIRFCRPLPSHSAIRPFVLSCRPPLDSLICKRLHRLSRVRSSLTLLPVPHALSTSNISHSLNLRSLSLPRPQASRSPPQVSLALSASSPPLSPS